MLYVDNQHRGDPYLNLALEEYLLRQVLTDEPIFLFYINKPAVILGRNQNVFEEIDLAYVKQQQIQLVRRLSGGGTVYHDLGNLNYSLLVPGQARLHDFAYFTRAISATLRMYGLVTELRNRSSLFVDGRKISGNAQYATAGKLMHHGTLLYDTDLEAMLRAITPAEQTIDSRAVPSVRSSVINLRELLPAHVSLERLRQDILRHTAGPAGYTTLALTSSDWAAVKALAAERYRSWGWTYGRSPRFTVYRHLTTDRYDISTAVHIDHGRITGVDVYSEPDASGALQAVFLRLQNLPYDPDVLAAALAGLVSENAGPAGLQGQQLLALLF